VRSGTLICANGDLNIQIVMITAALYIENTTVGVGAGALSERSGEPSLGYLAVVLIAVLPRISKLTTLSLSLWEAQTIFQTLCLPVFLVMPRRITHIPEIFSPLLTMIELLKCYPPMAKRPIMHRYQNHLLPLDNLLTSFVEVSNTRLDPLLPLASLPS
jgi:hypothetical protein